MHYENGFRVDIVINEEDCLPEINITKEDILAYEPELITITPKDLERFKAQIIRISDADLPEVIKIGLRDLPSDLTNRSTECYHGTSWEAAEQIRKLNKDMVIIAQTAYAMADDRQKYLAAGFDDYISKPIIPKNLLTLIEKHFH